MKLNPPFRRLWLAAYLAGALMAVAPLRAADSTMDQPGEAAANRPLHYLAATAVSAAVLLPPPPLPGSPEQAADLDQVREVFHAASSNDMAAAYSEKNFTIFTFTPAIGDFFQPGKFPLTEAFFEKVKLDAETITDNGKRYFKRPRPYTTDPSLANGKLEKSFGYPSGHSTESMVLALVLADLFPARHDAIIAKARSIGWHRVEIARHYSTDIYAGRVLAQAIVREMQANPEFQRAFGQARSEIATAKP